MKAVSMRLSHQAQRPPLWAARATNSPAAGVAGSQ